MLDFYPMDGEHHIGFVEVPIEFEQWLIAVSGISFEDVALNILGEEDGQVELIMDYDDYMNLCDLYYEYDTLGWMVLEDPDYVEEINAIPDYEAEDVDEALITGSIGGEPAIFRFRKGEQDQTGFTTGRIVVGDEDELHWMSRDIAHQIPNYPERHGKAFKTWKKNIWGLHPKLNFNTRFDAEAAEDFIEWNYTAEGSNCFICGRLWRPGDYEGHDNICITCADKWEYDEGGPEGEGYYRHAETFEAPYAGLGALFNFGDNPSALGGFTAKELTESSAIHGDFDSASLNYSGKQNLEVRQSEASADDYGDVEYIILELLTDAQLEEEYGEVMDDYGIGRDDLPQQLEDDYRTADEAEYLREKYLKEAETFDAHARYNIHRFTSKNNPRHNISGTRRKIKQKMWEDTTATVGVKGAAAIIAAVVVGIIAWKKK